MELTTVIDKIQEEYNLERDVVERMAKCLPETFLVYLSSDQEGAMFDYVRTLNFDDVLSIVAYCQYFTDMYRNNLPTIMLTMMADDMRLTTIIERICEKNPEFDLWYFIFALPQWAMSKSNALHVLRYMEDNPKAHCVKCESVVTQLSQGVDRTLLNRMVETLLPRMSSTDFIMLVLDANRSKTTPSYPIVA